MFASSFLLTDILRNRWGFKGYVVSDCDAIRDIYQTHHYVETPHEAAALAINAGSDLNCGRTYSESLMKAVQEKFASEEAIRNALARVLTGRVLLGEFNAPDAVPWSGLTAEILEGKGHRNLAREAARQSLVLLKNEGNLLPLDKGNLKRIAVIGPMAGAAIWAVTVVGRLTLSHLYAGISSCAWGVAVSRQDHGRTVPEHLQFSWTDCRLYARWNRIPDKLSTTVGHNTAQSISRIRRRSNFSTLLRPKAESTFTWTIAATRRS